MKKIFFFPKYSSKGPSSRYRIYNYLPYYSEAGIDYSISPLFADWYLEGLWAHKKTVIWYIKIVWAYIYRIFRVLTLPRKSVVYIGAELLPYCPPFLEAILTRRGIKYIIEFDDAVFHNIDQSKKKLIHCLLYNKFPYVIQNASVVITGSAYLTKYCQQYNNSILEIPTSIDWSRYSAFSHKRNDDKFVIGWIGSPVQSKQVLHLKNVFEKLKTNCNYELRLIGFDKMLEEQLVGIPYKIIPWSENTELQNMSLFDVGIMPLEDTPFNRGKCAFKLVQYMAMGIPTISTPLLSNVNIDRGNGNLFASTEKDWLLCFLDVYSNSDVFKIVGDKNRETSKEFYTIQANKKRYIEMLKQI